jgi:taurine dioxygenase
MNVESVPLSPAIGARVEGIDLRQPLDDRTKGHLRALLDENCIVLIRNQSLSEDQLAAASSWVGTLAMRGRPSTVRREGNPFITKVSNIRENGKLIGSLPDGEMLFHADSAFNETPHRASFLYAVEIPSAGGNTCFANLFRAYENLPAALKQRLEGKFATQTYDYSTYEKADQEAGHSNVRSAVHPVVIRHPANGRRVLYVNRLMTTKIEGLDRRESDSLIAELLAYAEDPSIIYEHKWCPGDLLAWDNLSSNHSRTDFSPAERRLLLRGTTVGDYRPAA